MKFFFANYGLPIVTPVKRAAVNCVKNKELSSIQRSTRQINTRNRDAIHAVALQKIRKNKGHCDATMTSKCQAAPIRYTNR